MIVKSKLAENTVFYVKNDLQGKAFIATMREHLNAGWRLNARGRNEDRQQFVDEGKKRYGAQLRQSLPRELASYFAVYLSNPKLREKDSEQRRQAYAQLYQELRAANSRAEVFKAELQRELEKRQNAEYGWNHFETEADQLARQLSASQLKLANAQHVSWARVWRDVKFLTQQFAAKFA